MPPTDYALWVGPEGRSEGLWQLSVQTSGCTSDIKLSSSKRRAWIVNTSKHLSEINSSHPGLAHLENAAFAGKWGSPLITLSGDAMERLDYRKAKTHARSRGIGGPEPQACLETLKIVRMS